MLIIIRLSKASPLCLRKKPKRSPLQPFPRVTLCISFVLTLLTYFLYLLLGMQTFVPTSGRQVAGRDYSHQDFCLSCWDSAGDIIICDICPAAYHMACIGLKTIPGGVIWQCPHHVCCKCLRKSSAAGLLFRCECCPNAYCEDCLPIDHTVTGDSERLNKLGFRLPGSACYILCTQDCIDFYFHLSKTEGGDIVPHARHRTNENLAKKLRNAAKIASLNGNGDSKDGENGQLLSSGGNGNQNHSPMDAIDPVKAIGMCQLGDIKVPAFFVFFHTPDIRFVISCRFVFFATTMRDSAP